jgi:hypothetical protein
MSSNYRDVYYQINSVLTNMSKSISDEECITIVHTQLAEVFGLYIDRDQITIRESIKAD